jgi:hypothetical protein
MADYVSRNNLISPFQSGFRPAHRTLTALMSVSDNICLNLEVNLVLFDFSRVLYSICHLPTASVNVLTFISRQCLRLFLLIFFLGIKRLVVVMIVFLRAH